jgi:hypothetical protein
MQKILPKFFKNCGNFFRGCVSNIMRVKTLGKEMVQYESKSIKSSKQQILSGAETSLSRRWRTGKRQEKEKEKYKTEKTNKNKIYTRRLK